MSRQREVIYGERREVLEGADLQDQVHQMIDEVVETYVVAATEGFPEEWDLEALWTALKTIYPVSLRHQDLEREAGGRDGLDRDTLLSDLQADAQKAYEAREAEVGSEVMRELERQVLLSVLDRKWREHLYEMDYLREGIGLRAYSQRDPLVEYQREGFDMFNAMKEGIREETVGFLFNLEVEVEEEEEAEIDVDLLAAADTSGARGVTDDLVHDHAHDHAGNGHEHHAPHIFAKGLQPSRAPQNLTYSAPSEDGEAEVKGQTVTNADDPYAGASRNALCPCGSGKKYKKCHGAPGGPDRPQGPTRGLSGSHPSAELQGGAAPPPVHQLDACGDRARPLAVAHVHADLGCHRRGAEQVHAPHLAAQPAHPTVARRRAGQQGGPALELGVDRLAGPAQQLARAPVAADDLHDRAREAVRERLELRSSSGDQPQVGGRGGPDVAGRSRGPGCPGCWPRERGSSGREPVAGG